MQRKTAAALILIIGLSGAWFTGLFSENLSDEEQIRAAIHRVAEGAERADINVAIAPFSQTYNDSEGLDRRGMYGLLWSQFKKRGSIRVWMSAIDVQIDGGTAIARFDAAVLEGEKGSFVGIPINADLLTFEVELAEEHTEWMIVGHSRAPAWVLPDQTP